MRSRRRLAKRAWRRVEPELRRRARLVWPPVGTVRFGSLRRLTPISRIFGADRGQPIDRYYIESFLARHSQQDHYIPGDVRGNVIEVGDDRYARQFGAWGTAPSHVTSLEILSADSSPGTTVIADLTNALQIPSNEFDCVICTQTLQLIYDIQPAIQTLYRILKPGGVVLATAPGISQLCRPDADLRGDYWRFTSKSFRRLFEEFFAPENVTVEAFGNVLSSIAFLEGLSTADLKGHELELVDPSYELLIAVRARK